MIYATADQFIEAYGLKETTDLLADELDLLTQELLTEALAGEFTDGRTDEEKRAALAAVDRLTDALVESGKRMDGYFMSVVELPLTTEQIDGAPVKGCCLELARCDLKDDDDNMSEAAEKRCKRWIEWLRDISSGKVKLLTIQTAAQGVRYGKTPSAYHWDRFNQ